MTRRLTIGLVALVACGGGGPPATAPAVDPAVVLAPAAAEDPIGPELPDSDAFGVLRFESVAALRAGGVPIALAAADSHAELVQLSVPPSLYTAWREDRAVDAIFVADVSLLGPPSYRVLWSSEATSWDEVIALARRAGEPLSEETDGRVEVGPDGAPQCTLFTGGRGEPRLLCGSEPQVRADHVDVAIALASRALPPGEVVGELWGPAFRAALGKRLAALRVLAGRVLVDYARYELPTLAPVLVPILPPLAEEGMRWIDDLEVVRFRIARSQADTDVEVSVRFSGESSSLAQSVRAAALAAAAPPSLFWQMPADAHTTFFSAPRDVKRLEELRADLTRRMSTSIEQTDPSLRELLLTSVAPHQSFVFASGGASVPLPVDGPFAAGHPTAERLRAEVVSRFGWQIFAVDEPIDRYLTYMDKSFQAYKKGPLYALVYDTFTGLCQGLPPITRREVKTGPMPKGTVAFDMTVPSAMLEKCMSKHGSVTPAQPIQALLIAVPDGDKTWIGLGLEPKDLEARILAAMGRDGTRGGLAGVATLAPLRSEKLVLGGHVTPLGLAMAGSNLTTFQRGAYTGHQAVRAAQLFTNGGLVPMPYAVLADVTNGVELRARLRVPHDALQ